MLLSYLTGFSEIANMIIMAIITQFNQSLNPKFI